MYPPPIYLSVFLTNGYLVVNFSKNYPIGIEKQNLFI
jgi:hypothetical protein